MKSKLDSSILSRHHTPIFPHHDNIIYLPRGPLGRYVSRRTLCERGLVLMVTYSDLFQFVIMLCAVITLVIHFTRKK